MIAVVFALEFEGADFVAATARRMCVDVWYLGVTGQRAAAVFEAKLATQKPALVVSAGLAGALTDGVGVGDVFIGANETSPFLLDLLPAIPRANLLTSSDVVSTVEEKRRLGVETRSDIVDMETSHLSRICADSRIPLLSLRAVSDNCAEDLPLPGNVLIDPRTGRPAPDLVFKHLLKNPRSALGLKRLVTNSKMARKHLSEHLNEILPVLLRNSLDVPA